MMPRVYLLKKKNASKFSVFLGFTHDSQILELVVLSDLFHKYMLQEILLVNFTSFFFFSIP